VHIPLKQFQSPLSSSESLAISIKKAFGMTAYPQSRCKCQPVFRWRFRHVNYTPTRANLSCHLVHFKKIYSSFTAIADVSVLLKKDAGNTDQPL
jgi:hypothetical protein